MFWERIYQYQEKNTGKAQYRDVFRTHSNIHYVSISGESSIFDVWLDSKYASAIFSLNIFCLV